ncbi:MFS transporter [Carboxydochorda subterranea]|uniref:MFS transporter n=1 Tax=Carboxydichorda subterranea TaxID=3109565 RepID=A0ABZ1BWB4_9FIRM|nr:MFS transporter [Limnochorda sp. L945t]WRP16878.1 MFS transporter [Limnochorda sp. L945t]
MRALRVTRLAESAPAPGEVAAWERGAAGHPLRWRILSAIFVGTLMGPVDGSVVGIALPVITQDLRTTLSVSEWVAMAYLLVISSLLLTWGRLGDMYGHRRTYLSGFGLFTGGSLLCAASPGIGWLIAFRAVQAVGAGMMMAAGPAIITDVFPASERGRALGTNAVAVAAGLAIGPVLGGLLVEHFGWRSIFSINLPIGLVGTLWAARVLPGPRRVVRERFDLAGAMLLFSGLLLVLLALSQAPRWGWASAATLGSAGAGAALLGLFVAVERRIDHPMVELSVFKNRTFVLANLSSLANYLAQSSVTFLLPFYLQNLRGIPPDRAGVLMLGFPVALTVIAPAAGYLTDRWGSRWLAAGGMALMAVAVANMTRLDGATPLAGVFWGLALLGLGSALFQTPNNSTIMGSVPRERLGIAGGMLASMRNIGMVLGIAVSGTVFMAVAGAQVETAAAEGGRFLAGLHGAMAAGAGIALLGAVASVAALPWTGRRRRAAVRVPRLDADESRW